jgi:hypothetical protein
MRSDNSVGVSSRFHSPMKTALLISSIALLFSSIASAVSPKAPAEPPAKFLRTNNPAWQRVLAAKITGDFRSATIGQVSQFVGERSQANIVVTYGVASAAPKITRKFQAVPLRTVLYQLSLDTGGTIGWHYEQNLATAITISMP